MWQYFSYRMAVSFILKYYWEFRIKKNGILFHNVPFPGFKPAVCALWGLAALQSGMGKTETPTFTFIIPEKIKNGQQVL